MVSGISDFALVAGLVLAATLLANRLLRALLFDVERLNAYVRMSVVTVGSVVVGLAATLAVLGGV